MVLSILASEVRGLQIKHVFELGLRVIFFTSILIRKIEIDEKLASLRHAKLSEVFSSSEL